ncbi:MAG: 3'-5' exoribonuclease [Clostridia bacterium]|nr:3'-5' exoribonuclease [Clostridia bacterium]
MYTIKNSAEFLAAITELDERLKDIKLNSVEVDRAKGSVTYNFICDKAVDAELREKILDVAEKNTAQAFGAVAVNVTKIVSNGELVDRAIFRFLKENYPSVSIFLDQDDVSSTVDGNLVKYKLRLTQDGAEYVIKNGALKKLNEYLSKNFCSDFVGSTEIKPENLSVNILSEEVFEGELQKTEYRTIKVRDMVVIDDATMDPVAVYIEDLTDGPHTVCGRITEISERETKTGKPFFIIRLDDTTGITSGVYFSKKSTYQRVKALKAGDAIIARGTLGEYNGRRSFTFDKINFCAFPDDFVKESRRKKTTPRNYKLVFPEPANTVKVSTVFDYNEKLPEELTAKTYVVFDFETTGTDILNNGITEIGAVKIVEGKIKEQFTTLVKPDYPISKEIQDITGITPDMVADAPTIDKVLPDFLKFIEYSVIVAHNAAFDTGFLRRFAGENDYDVNNAVMDTLEMSRRLLPALRHHDLKTVADYFGIVFRHHRALSDAYATAEAFIELMKMKYKENGE